MAEFCPRGHRLSPDNVVSNGRGHRACRTCRIAWQRRRRVQWATADLCTNCGHERENPALRTCARCRERAHAAHAALAA